MRIVGLCEARSEAAAKTEKPQKPRGAAKTEKPQKPRGAAKTEKKNGGADEKRNNI